MRPFLLLALPALLATSGCGLSQSLNLSFPVELSEARTALEEMEETPRKLQRPVIVLSGFMGPGWLAQSIECKLKTMTDGGEFETASFFFKSTFESCRDHLIEAVDEAFPSDDPNWTTEVDVIAISMGGLVARYAAIEPPADPENGGNGDASQTTKRRLRIARLFTIGSPHRGAKMAKLPTFDSKQIAMRPGSPFVKMLNDAWHERSYELFPYVRIGDLVVGEENAAPPGELPWWVSNKFLESAHVGAHGDERILADIARRLRGEQPLTRYPPQPFPSDEEKNDPNTDGSGSPKKN